MEQPTPQPGGENQAANSYGTDDPSTQAQIEQARCAASHERQRDRAELERLVEHGMDPDDAEVLIEFTHAIEDQQRRAARTEINPRTPEATEVAGGQPRIYVVATALPARMQRSGWIAADQSAEELTEAIAHCLGLPPSTSAGRWAIQASTGFAGLDLHGYTDLALVAQLAEGVASHGAAYAAWVELTGTSDPELFSRFDDYYVGSYDSPEAWARSVGEDLEWENHLDQVVEPVLRPYVVIDYARVARDQRHAWDVLTGTDGRTHVFLR